MERGLEKGIQQGIEQGILQGKEQGIQQGTVETARNLILKAMDNAFVQEVTQLSVEAIEKIRADVFK